MINPLPKIISRQACFTKMRMYRLSISSNLEEELCILRRTMKTKLTSVVGLLVLLILLFTPSIATAYSNSGDYYEVTCYWESGAGCIPFSFHTHATAYGSSQRIEANIWRVDSHEFGGWVFPKVTSCGTSAWVKQSTYWVDSSGNRTIGNWQLGAVWCDPNYSCAHFYSYQQFFLIPDPLHGDFYSATGFGSECLPAGSLSAHLLTVYL